MPPKPKYTKEQLVEAALQITRESGSNAVTARSIATRLNASPGTMFTHFDSMEALMAAVRDAAEKIWDEYATRGLAMTPAFKGFGIMIVRFAMEEPMLHRLLFMERPGKKTLEDLVRNEGHFEAVVCAIRDTFPVTRDQAEQIYFDAWVLGMGLSALCANNACRFTDEELSELMGRSVRGSLLCIKAGDDPLFNLVPSEQNEDLPRFKM